MGSVECSTIGNRGWYGSTQVRADPYQPRLPHRPAFYEDQSSTGIVYWFADPQNFYWFAISTAGTYAVFRYMKDKWQNIIPWTTSDAVNKGPQAKNALRVHTEGNVSTLFVNDKQIAKIKGVPPKDGQAVGW